MCRDKIEGGRRCPGCSPAARRAKRATDRHERATEAVEAFIGATPYRPESTDLMAMSSRPSYYDTDEWVEYDESIRAAAERHGVELVDERRAAGLWEGDSEPAAAYRVRADNPDDIRAWAGEVAGRYNQDSVMVGFYDKDGADVVYGFGSGDVDADDALTSLRDAGFPAGRVYDGRLEVASTQDMPLGSNALAVLQARLGGGTEDSANVEFIEKNERHLAHTPVKEIQMLRQNYAAEHGIPPRQPIPHLTERDDIAAALAYDAAEHDPTNPKVARSYRVFRQHVGQQWDVLTKAGYSFEPWHGDTEQPYANSAEMLADVRDNKHLYYFRTDVSQTTEGALPPDHPMARQVTVTMPDGTRRRMLANDVFRAVHDTIAHSEGHQFGPYGEKRAWWTHRSSLPRESRLALWCETRAQNTWTNAGPHMLDRDDDGTPRLKTRTDPGWLPISQRPYAAQKCVIVDRAFL
ncbi:hypothetical protein H9623_17865 [Oerskovia sp. Sa1BUA8]|uniref:Uncharacterized protein n=1 Tax=Oerskovia douganii TaxID=2762210 RepID=A0A9D5Z0F8_9CELL|nr:hypothetical protein [Oerskovia douganii]MBE7702160.1 hypothetical protein [Oerskovia douganii]